MAIDIETGAYEVDPDESRRIAGQQAIRTRRSAAADWFSVRAPIWPPPSFRGSVIEGQVTTEHEAVIRLTVRGPSGQGQQVEAVIDTGFSGWFSLPPEWIASLGLPWRRRIRGARAGWRCRGRALLADGSESVRETRETGETGSSWTGKVFVSIALRLLRLSLRCSGRRTSSR